MSVIKKFLFGCIHEVTYHELVCLQFEWLIKKLQQIGTVLKLCKALLSSNVLEKEIQDDSEGGGGGGGNSEFEESLHLLNTSDSHCLDKTTKALFKMFLTKPNNVFFLVHTQPGTSEVTH